MNSKTIPFEEIALSRKEMKALKESVKGAILLDSCKRLRTLNLVDEIMLPISGYALKSTGKAKINDNGANYLAYVRRRNAEYRSTRRVAVTALIISILSLIAQVAISLLTQ